MAGKRKEPHGELQLELVLEVVDKNPKRPPAASIISFRNAPVLEIRRMARARVEAAKIFRIEKD